MLGDLAQILMGLFGGGVVRGEGHELTTLRTKGTVRSALRLAEGTVDGVGFDWVRGRWCVSTGRLTLRGTTVRAHRIERVFRPKDPATELDGLTSFSSVAVLDCGTGRVEWALPPGLVDEALRRLLPGEPGTSSS